jgi:hypothetical protein
MITILCGYKSLKPQRALREITKDQRKINVK